MKETPETLGELLDSDQEQARMRDRIQTWKGEGRLLAETVAEYRDTLLERGLPEKLVNRLTRQFQNDLTWLGNGLFSEEGEDLWPE